MTHAAIDSMMLFAFIFNGVMSHLNEEHKTACMHFAFAGLFLAYLLTDIFK